MRLSKPDFLALAVAILFSLAGAPLARAAAPSAPARPNIIFILGDDLGPDALGCYGSKLYADATPRIDALAAASLRFSRCYATGICSPSRAQYATGQYPFRNGVLDIDGSNYRSDPHKPMLTKMLQEAGYVTGKTGKADICASVPDEQLSGWQYWGKDVSKWKLKGPSQISAERYEYFPAAQLDFALDFIERNRPSEKNGHKPFYFLFGFNNPHVPIERTPDTAPGVSDVAALYKDNLKFIDKVVGAIVDKLAAAGCLDNTIVLISGDNGSLGNDRGARLQSPIKDPKTGQFRPIVGGKADRAHNKEGTAWVPLVVHWPAGIGRERAGKVQSELVDFTDFLPTFAELAGAKLPGDWVIDGQSFAPLLRGEAAYKPRAWVYHQIENNWCLRGPDYRLDRDGRFFDMTGAPFAMVELKSLTPEQQAIRQEYQKVLDGFDPARGPTYEGHQDSEWKNPAWEWKRKHFGMRAWETPTAGDESDPDKDGVTNIFERAFEWNPNKPGDTMPQPQRLPDGSLSITVPQVEHNDVRVIIEVTPDGRTWTPVKPTGTGPFTATANPGGDKPALRLRAQRVTAWKEP